MPYKKPHIDADIGKRVLSGWKTDKLATALNINGDRAVTPGFYYDRPVFFLFTISIISVIGRVEISLNFEWLRS